MKYTLRYVCGVLLAAAILTACKNNAVKEARYIPKEASMVCVLDAGQMHDKLQNGGISVDSLIARLFRNEPADSKDRAKFNELRTNSGINWDKQWFFFMLQKAYPDKSNGMTFSALGTLSDPAKWEAYLKKQEDLKDKPIQKEKDYSYLLMQDRSMLAWDKDHVIATFHNHSPSFNFDTSGMRTGQPDSINTEAELKAQVAKYFTQKTSESLADESRFTAMFKEKADGYMYTSTNNAPSYLSMLPVQVPKLEEFIKDNYSISTFNFEDGRIAGKSTSYVNPMVANLLKQYTSPGVDLSMLQKYPSANLNGFMLFSINPQIIGGLLKQLEVEGFANMALQKSGLTSEDLYKAFKGDFALMVSDIGMMGIEPQMKTDEKSMITKKPWGKMLLNMTIGDKASFDKIMSKAVDLGGLVRTPSGGYKGSPMLSAFGIFLSADDKNLIVASDSLTYAQYTAGTSKAVIGKDVMDKFDGKKSAIIYFDMAKTLGSFTKDTASKYYQSLRSTQQTFKDIIGSMDTFDGKTLKSNFEVRLQDTKQNSLVTLTRLFTDIAVDMRLQAARNPDSKLFPGGVPAIIRTN